MSSKSCVVKRMCKAQKGKFMNEFEFFDIEPKLDHLICVADWRKLFRYFDGRACELKGAPSGASTAS